MPEPKALASFQILRIVFHAVFLEKQLQFLDECHLSVMLLLGFDVTPDILLAAGAHGECGVTLLPRELRAMMTRSPQ